MFKYFINLVVMLFFCVRSHCKEPNHFEIDDPRIYQLLEHFFRRGIDQGQYGYILEGAKPIHYQSFLPLDMFPVSKSKKLAEEQFYNSLLIEELMPVLEKINQFSSQFLFKNTKIKKTDLFFHEFLFINKPQLSKTIKENLNLFRLILTPSCEAKEIIDQIIYSNSPLTEILNNYDTLLGIVLGYLPHNSLLGGREYSLHTQSISQEHPPYERQSRLLQPKGISNALMPDLYGLYYLAHAGDDCNHFQNHFERLKPSHGFRTITDEIDHLKSKKENLPSCLREKPSFIFGPYFTEDTSNESFFELLKGVQNRIRKLSKKENLVKILLEKILGYAPKITCDHLYALPSLESLLEINQEQWISILTKAANRFKRQQDKLAFLESFASPCESYRVPPKIMTASPNMQKGFELALKNLEKADTYFKKIPKNFVSVIPKQLFYQIIRKGKRNPVKGSNEIRVHYALEDLEGNILSANYNSWFKLSEVFQGFRLGVQGMLEGEKRKILIHPALGYGPFTTLPPCSTLVLTIELLEIAEEEDAYFPPIEPIDFSLIRDKGIYKDIKLSIDQLPYYRGSFYAEMFEKSRCVDKQKVLAKLKSSIL